MALSVQFYVPETPELYPQETSKSLGIPVSLYGDRRLSRLYQRKERYNYTNRHLILISTEVFSLVTSSNTQNVMESTEMKEFNEQK